MSENLRIALYGGGVILGCWVFMYFFLWATRHRKGRSL